MSLFTFLTVVQAIVAAALVGVILMQRSEGGGLGIGGGGSPGGLMSARGAADFLTRATRWLAILFVGLSIALAAVAVETTSTGEIETTLERTTVPAENDPLGTGAAGSGEAAGGADAEGAEGAGGEGAAQPSGDADPLGNVAG